MPFLEDDILVSVKRVVIEPVVTLSIQFFAYGFYVLLFGLCMNVLRSRRDRGYGFSRRLYTAWTVVLFVLCTIAAGCEMYRFLASNIVEFIAVKNQDETGIINYFNSNKTKSVMDGFFFSLFIVSNIVADSIIIYRCYIIWNSQKRVVIIPVIISVIASIIGFVGTVMVSLGERDETVDSNIVLLVNGDLLQLVYLASSAGLNFILTLMTAGRIWWITREARKTMGKSTNQRYKTVVAIILESGILYPIFSILHIALTQSSPLVYVPVNFLPTAVQMSGIAPTLILVRASMGKSVDSVQAAVSTMMFEDGLASTGQTESTAAMSDQRGIRQTRLQTEVKVDNLV